MMEWLVWFGSAGLFGWLILCGYGRLIVARQTTERQQQELIDAIAPVVAAAYREGTLKAGVEPVPGEVAVCRDGVWSDGVQEWE